MLRTGSKNYTATELRDSVHFAAFFKKRETPTAYPGTPPRRQTRSAWEIIADGLSKAGWSLGWVSALDLEGRTIWVADAHRGNGKRLIVRADEKLTAFLELERAIS
jgi:hypothetical protein